MTLCRCCGWYSAAIGATELCGPCGRARTPWLQSDAFTQSIDKAWRAQSGHDETECLLSPA